MNKITRYMLAALSCAALLVVSGCSREAETKGDPIAKISDPAEKIKAIENSNMSPEEKAKYKKQAEEVAAASKLGR